MTIRHSRSAPLYRSVTALVAAGAVAGAITCTGDESPGGPSTTTSSTTSSSSTSVSSSTSSSSGAPPVCPSASGSSGNPACKPLPLPTGVPAGWEEYTDWSCDCRFYVPSCTEALPPPIVWEPCVESPNGIDCRQMAVDWQYLGTTAVALYNFLDWGPGQKPVLAFRRIMNGEPQPHTIDLVAEVDGPVRNAFWWQMVPGQPSSNPGCYVRIDSMSEGKWVISVGGHDANGAVSESQHKGAIGGPIDQLHPPLLTHIVDEHSYSWVASNKWVGYGNAPELKDEMAPWPWDGQPVTFLSSSAVDPDHLNLNNLVIRGDAAFWEATSIQAGGINIWTADKGSRPFIRWVGDYTKKTGGFGTDGVDMVWTYGEKQTASDPEFTGSVMTAPFVTDPDLVQPRRLRSFTKNIANETWAVGCGYAARGWSSNDTLVVRLSDGVSWVVHNSANMTFFDPIGLTCDEVFILGEYGGVWNIARVRLDSLGPGIAPD